MQDLSHISIIITLTKALSNLYWKGLTKVAQQPCGHLLRPPQAEMLRKAFWTIARTGSAKLTAPGRRWERGSPQRALNGHTESSGDSQPSRTESLLKKTTWKMAKQRSAKHPSVDLSALCHSDAETKKFVSTRSELVPLGTAPGNAAKEHLECLTLQDHAYGALISEMSIAISSWSRIEDSCVFRKGD